MPPENEAMTESESDEDDLVPLLSEAINVVQCGRASDFLRMSNGFFAECLRKIAHASTALSKKSQARFIEFLDREGTMEAADVGEIISIMRSMMDELNTTGKDDKQ